MLEPFGTFWFQKGVKGSGTLCEALTAETTIVCKISASKLIQEKPGETS